MEIFLGIILLIFIIWIVGQSRGVKHYQYQKSSQTKSINLKRNSSTVIYNGIDLSKSEQTLNFDLSKFWRDEKVIEKPVVHFDLKNELLIIFSSVFAKSINKLSSTKFKPEPYKNIIPFKEIKCIKEDKYTDFRLNCYDIELDEKFGKLRIEFPDKEYSMGKKFIEELNKKTVGNNVYSSLRLNS